MSVIEDNSPASTETRSNLVRNVKNYVPDAGMELVDKAISFAKEKHGTQTRASGEPYYLHPLEVANILADLRMDLPSILTAILHDTLEDTDVTYKEISQKFGEEVATLVNGVSKLTQIESKTLEGKQGENFRKLLLAISEDIRVLLVKLADRLHNMRTLEYVREEKRQRISKETLEIYAPLAERIGIQTIKQELEDLSFGYLFAEARESITNRLTFLRKEGTDLVNTIIQELYELLKHSNIHAQVTGREKTRYSIWRKMQRKNVAFEQLSDIMAFRIIVDSVETCYNVLGIIHSSYPTVPGRFKDYISTPKQNGYRSIHTAVIGPRNQRIEIQIRTEEMDREAEYGVAAHWAYKINSKNAVKQKDIMSYRWLRELLDILEHEQRPEDFLENTKLELFQENVYVFTPKGDLIELPVGSTPVDFAYAIHSDIGDKCVGSKVNGRIAPLNTKLANGDQVDVITSKSGHPSPTWERFVVTGKARSHIRKYIRMKQRDEYITLGRAMLQKIFRQEGYDYTEKAVHGVLDQFRAESAEDVYAEIGSGTIVAREVFKTIFPSHKTEAAKQSEKNLLYPRPQTTPGQREKKDKPMPIKGLVPGMAVHFARCCHPLPGDRIVGIVTTGKGVTVHTIDCDTLETFADTPERWIDISWGEGPDAPEAHIGRIEITFENKQGALGTLTTVIGKNGGNITNLKITNRSLDFWEMLIDIYVNDIKHLNNIIAALRATPGISSVERSRR